MTSHRVLTVALVLLSATAASAQPVHPAVPLDSLAQAFADAHGLPSLVLAVIDGERTVVGVGQVHGAAPDETTPYEIGSISKVLTSLALADAVARGEVTLSTPVGDLLPDTVAVGAHPDGPIRLVDLATHTSGLPRLDLSMGSAAGFDLANPYALYGPEHLLAFLARAEPATAPGTVYGYSNLGAGLLGFALARRAGTPYADLVRQRVLTPLGMDDTHIDLPEALAVHLAPAHGADGTPVPHWTWTEPTAGAGGWRSTAADLLVLAEAALDPATTPLADALALSLDIQTESAVVPRLGLGWHVGEVAGAEIAWHNGMVGGAASFLAVAPDADVAVVVLTNRQSSVDALGIGVLHRLLAVNE